MSNDWKPELDAIVGARHGGQIAGATTQLRDLDARFPHVAEIVYQLAWTCDILGHASEALPHYERALALGLETEEHAGALLGLGSTLRVLGQPARAAEVLRSGEAQFPDHREFGIFLALALHDLGQPAEALALALIALVDTTEDPGLIAHQRAIRFHANRLVKPPSPPPA